MNKDLPKKRSGYYYLNGKEYVSVTKVLGDTLAKPALYYWTGQQTCRIISKELEKFAKGEPWEINEKDVMAQLQLIVKESQKRGKYVHSLMELMAEGIDIQGKIEEQNKCYGQALLSWWETHKPEVIAKEVEIYSEIFGYAGRCDLVCKLNGDKWLIDFKSGKSIYNETSLQLVAYKQALSEMGVIEIDKMGCVLLMETGEFMFKESKDEIKNFLNVLEVFKWMKRKD